MSRLVRRHWPSDLSAGLSRRDRRGCEYAAYIPDLLAHRKFRFDGDVTADLVEAEASIALLNEKATALGDTEALARLLLRAECVASSQIEGLEVGGRRLLRAEAAREAGVTPEDVAAEEVLGNIEAMRWAVDVLGFDKAITVGGLLEVHRRLLADTRLAEHGGKVRDQQNWIGGSAFNPCGAVFVPPRRRKWKASLRISATSATAIRFPRSLKRRSRMPSSRPSTRSSTATGEPAASCCTSS